MDMKSTLLADAADAALTTFKARLLVLSSNQDVHHGYQCPYYQRIQANIWLDIEDIK